MHQYYQQNIIYKIVHLMATCRSECYVAYKLSIITYHVVVAFNEITWMILADMTPEL